MEKPISSKIRDEPANEQAIKKNWRERFISIPLHVTYNRLLSVYVGV